MYYFNKGKLEKNVYQGIKSLTDYSTSKMFIRI